MGFVHIKLNQLSVHLPCKDILFDISKEPIMLHVVAQPLLQTSKQRTSDRVCLVHSSSVMATPAAFTSAM